MPHLPRVPAFPIAGENSILTAAGIVLKIPAKEKNSPLIGHPAPEILAKDHLGREVSLHATIDLGRPIVLYFFPLAGSPHCTKESCSFRDAVGTSPIFNDLNAVVIGISQDPPARSRRFVDEHHLGFRILHDSNRQIMDAWGVGRGLLGLIDGRCTFIIDHEGIVRGMLDGVWDYQGHRAFAEKWLCRIEHELSGRERFYMEHEADDTVACDEASRNVKVIYGDPTAARAIASAPRHGAASTASKSTKSATSPKPSRQPIPVSLSIAAEAEGSSSLPRAKSRRNLKTWLRPSPTSNEAYDEPLHVDYKPTNRSYDDVARDPQRRYKLVDPARSARSADKVATRVRSLRLDDTSDSSPVHARDFAERSPHSRQESGSGSGWETPSTISARSISTGETSHTSPAPDSRDSAHAATLAAAIKSGIPASHAELERSGSAHRRSVLDGAANGKLNGVVASASNTPSAPSAPSARVSSLRKASMEIASAVSHASRLSPDMSGKGSNEAGQVTVYANGNIARMPLSPPSNGERSADSMGTIIDRRSRGSHFSGDASTDSTYSAGAASSLPVPPRPSARNGGAAAGVVAAAASARLQKSSRVRSPTLKTPTEDQAVSFVAPGLSAPQSETSAEDGYATDRVASSTGHAASQGKTSASTSGLESRRRVENSDSQATAAATTENAADGVRAASGSTGGTFTGVGASPRRALPQQPPAPRHALPSLPNAATPSSVSPSPSGSPSMSFVTGTSPTASSTFVRALRAANSHPSLNASLSSSVSGPIDPAHHSNHHGADAKGIERRLSNTPSLAASNSSAYDGSVAPASEYEYSPSLAESTHTFGGLDD